MKELALGGIDPERMSDASLSERLLNRACACLWVVCRSDGLVQVVSGEHAEQLQNSNSICPLAFTPLLKYLNEDNLSL